MLCLYKLCIGFYKLFVFIICRLQSWLLPWQLAVGEDGKVVAVLQETILEIRTSRDEYSSVVGKATGKDYEDSPNNVYMI